MAKEVTQPDTPARRETLEQWVAGHRGGLVPALFVASALFVALALWQVALFFRSRSGNTPLFLWGLGMALLFLFAGLYLQFEQPERAPAREGRFRLLILGLGGLAGLFTFLLGILLPLGPSTWGLGPWGRYFVQPAGITDAVPVLQLWRENWWRLAVVGLAVLGGLFLMFVSLQLARSVERTSAGMRRLLYGYNTALTGLLLLAILGLLNVLSYVHLPPFSALGKRLDWTPSQLYTLSDASVDILNREVKGTVDVIALMPATDRLVEEIQRLVENMKQYHRDINLLFYSPDKDAREFVRVFQEHRAAILEKLREDPLVERDIRSGRVGLVVIYRHEGKEGEQFIPYRSLLGRAGVEDEKFVFRGENQVMQALVKLLDKTPMKVVFTQGHGELGISERGPGAGRLGIETGESLSKLKSILAARGNYEFREVTLDVKGGSLGDADVVVIARPTTPFAPKAVEALRNYLNPPGAGKKGKLIVLLDVRSQNGKMLRTNLEPLLRQHNVEVGDTRLLAVSSTPATVPIIPYPLSSHPVALAFGSRGRQVTRFQFHQPRRVSQASGGGGRSEVEVLLVTSPDIPVWAESNLTASPGALLGHYTKLPEAQQPTVLRPQSVAVAVSESAPRAGLPAGHAPVGTSVPRMIVFGDASWVTDAALTGLEGSTAGADLFQSSLSWLGGRAGLGRNVAPDKVRPEYTLRDTVDSPKATRLEWLPLALVFLGIAGLGGGIWVTRRR